MLRLIFVQCVFVIRSGMVSGLYLKRLVVVHSLLGMRLETLLIADAVNNSSVLCSLHCHNLQCRSLCLNLFLVLHVLLNMSSFIDRKKKLIAFGGKKSGRKFNVYL